MGKPPDFTGDFEILDVAAIILRNLLGPSHPLRSRINESSMRCELDASPTSGMMPCSTPLINYC
jgi:hypothetical protein